ncbi:16647_t:CDS:2 [Cetraspora pellucida]|uniref:16647_t:CDS:1 n=1 Tax=Cetraspora pellucida TaxID=1433469 RepID=A0ACA9KQP4_9GLOM|nr:16647_t:CDS:2 [Cetraspora pellucida]
MEYADRGDLRACLTESKLDWTERLQILTDISFSLHNIHQSQYMHKDLHSGNILCKAHSVRDAVVSYISDLGLSNVHASLVERANQKDNYHEEDEADDSTLQIHPEAVYTCRIMDLGNLNEIGAVEEENDEENAYEENDEDNAYEE